MAQTETAPALEGVPSQQDLNDLLEKAKSSLVNQYPNLANNPRFKSELDDAFSKFVNEGTQRGSDYNEVWGKTVAPVVQKWASQAPRDIAANFSEKQRAFDALRASGVPAFQASEAVPDVLDTRNPFHVSDQAVINRDINSQNRTPRMDALGKADLAAAVKQYETTKGNVDYMTGKGGKVPQAELDQLEKDRQAVVALENPSGTKTPTAPTSAADILSMIPGLPNNEPEPFHPVASPQGTSSYVKYGHDGKPIAPAGAYYELGGKRVNLGDGQDHSAAGALNGAQDGLPDFTGVPAELGVNKADALATLLATSPRDGVSNSLSPIPPNSENFGKLSEADQKAAKANKIAADHPDWTRDQIILAVNGKMFGAQ